MSQGVYISISYLLPVEQLLQLAVQQLWSMMVQMYLDTLHPTLEVSHTSKGQLRHHQVASILLFHYNEVTNSNSIYTPL